MGVLVSVHDPQDTALEATAFRRGLEQPLPEFKTEFVGRRLLAVLLVGS